MRKPRQSESDGQFCFWCNLPTYRRVFHLWWRWKFTSSFWEALEGNLCPNVLAMHKTSTFTPLFNCMYTYQWHTTPFLVSLDNLTLVLGKPGPIHMRRQVRANKTKALVDEVEMLQANPYYAHVRYPDSRKTTDGHQAPQGQTKLLLPLDMLYKQQRTRPKWRTVLKHAWIYPFAVLNGSVVQ